MDNEIVNTVVNATLTPLLYAAFGASGLFIVTLFWMSMREEVDTFKSWGRSVLSVPSKIASFFSKD